MVSGVGDNERPAVVELAVKLTVVPVKAAVVVKAIL